jgi:hypothetical protein
MFRYFARLTEKYDLPVYPVVVFSYDTPLRQEPSRYEVTFPRKRVLKFEYTVVQLNRLPWRRFVKQENPVASALMAKMKMAPSERPKVRLECLRLLASLKLDPARTKLIGVFVDTYLSLSAQETKRFEREMGKLAPVERKATMELMTSWEKKGREEGVTEGIVLGQERTVQRLVNRRFGVLAQSITKRLEELSSEQLDELTDALLDFSSIADLEAWLNGRQ